MLNSLSTTRTFRDCTGSVRIAAIKYKAGIYDMQQCCSFRPRTFPLSWM